MATVDIWSFNGPHRTKPLSFLSTEDTPTCMECFSFTCRDNLLPSLTNTERNSQLLTTGYFSNSPPKPQGMSVQLIAAVLPKKPKEQLNALGLGFLLFKLKFGLYCTLRMLFLFQANVVMEVFWTEAAIWGPKGASTRTATHLSSPLTITSMWKLPLWLMRPP